MMMMQIVTMMIVYCSVLYLADERKALFPSRIFLEVHSISNLDMPKPNINPLTTNVPYHIETSPLICIANQLTGFYMVGNIGC